MSKDYIPIVLNGQRVGLKFGGQSFHDFNKKMEAVPCWTTVEVDGKMTDSLTELGVAHVIYSGYTNNCHVKNEAPTIPFDYFYEYVEENIRNRELRDEKIMPVIHTWLALIAERTKQAT